MLNKKESRKWKDKERWKKRGKIGNEMKTKQ
jgi:hypothetical protein